MLGVAKATPYATRPDVTAKGWAIVPADELVPQWKVVTVGGRHPLVDGEGPLALPLCATGAPRMHVGTTYPAKDVASWFEHTDFVHVSNEVSFVPDCEPKPDTRQQPFCSREKYIELLEAVHANIIELDGSHLSDFGSKWLTHTIEMYEQRGWHFFGGGR